MKYYKWSFNTVDTNYPARVQDLDILFSDGGDPSYGGYVVSAVSNSLDVSNYAVWNMSEITAEDALNMAQVFYPSASLDGQLNLSW